jgi:hypothetical protein
LPTLISKDEDRQSNPSKNSVKFVLNVLLIITKN